MIGIIRAVDPHAGRLAIAENLGIDLGMTVAATTSR